MPLEKVGIHWYMTDEEVIALRNQLDGMRSSGNYKPRKMVFERFK